MRHSFVIKTTQKKIIKLAHFMVHRVFVFAWSNKVSASSEINGNGNENV